MDSKVNKTHRKPASGPSAERKKEKKISLSGNQQRKNAEKNNPKAFAPRSGRNAERLGRRNMDMAQKKLHVPQIDRSVEEPPPIVVAVVGPPGVSVFVILSWLSVSRQLFPVSTLSSINI